MIGGSAGSHHALYAICAGLPEGFAAPVLVVVHQPPHHRSALASVLGRVGPLEAANATHEERL